MVPEKFGLKEIQDRLSQMSEKLRFLVKICREADSDTENRFCVELLERELEAYAESVEEAAQGLLRSGPVGPGPTPPGKGPLKPEPPKAGPGPAKGPGPSAPLDFAIDD